MPTTNSTQLQNRNRNHFVFSFPHPEEKRRDGLLRTAWMMIVAGFKCRPSPRGPWDETATCDQTPWAYPLTLARLAMAAAIRSGDQMTIDQTLEGVRAFCREFEADITSMVPEAEAESVVAIALDETHVEGPANEVQMALVRNPDPIAAERAVLPLERHHNRLGALIRECRRLARSRASTVSVTS
jgi:hypothetical protein